MEGSARRIGVVLLLAAEVVVGAAQRTRRFEKQRCQYTLPSGEWRWTELPDLRNGVFAASNEREGLILTLTVRPATRRGRIDDRFIAGYERGFREAGDTTKRGGRRLTSQGLPCYQLETTLDAVNRTAVFRAFMAHGLGYQLQLTGTADPVEQRPDFEAILNGFQLMEPSSTPVDPRKQRDEETRRRSQALGGFGGVCLLAALVLFVLKRLLRKPWHAQDR